MKLNISTSTDTTEHTATSMQLYRIGLQGVYKFPVDFRDIKQIPVVS